jgi:hypothetical protein
LGTPTTREAPSSADRPGEGVVTNLAHGSSAIYKKMERLIRTQISPELVDTTAEDQH